MAENKKRYKTAPSREGAYVPKEVKFSDVGPDENELEPTPEKEESTTGRLIRIGAKLLILTILLTIGALIYKAWTPQNLDDIAGYGAKREEINSAVRNLPNLLKRAQQANQPLVLSERDINQYLSYAVNGRQGGPLSLVARYDGVAVRLYDGYAEVIIVRNIGDKYKHTISLYMTTSHIETYEGPTVMTEFAGSDSIGSLTIGGRIGSLPVPQGYLTLAQEAFASLKKVLEPELEFILDPYRPIVIRRGELEIMSSSRNAY